ncbi:TPA: fimbrial protein [Escherichia coli]
MLNIIHRLKSGMFPALFFLTSASVLAQPLIIPPGHWQEGMAVGVTEFSGTLYVPEVSWQWQPRAVRMSTPDAVQAGLTTGKSGMVSESRRGQDFYILGGHTTSLTTSRPGLQPSVTLLQVTPSSLRIAARRELSREQIRYGEITFIIRHLLEWQVNDYEWSSDYVGLTTRPDAFVSGAEALFLQKNDSQCIADAWGASLRGVRDAPGAEEAVKHWAENLMPVVYF